MQGTAGMKSSFEQCMAADDLNFESLIILDWLDCRLNILISYGGIVCSAKVTAVKAERIPRMRFEQFFVSWPMRSAKFSKEIITEHRLYKNCYPFKPFTYHSWCYTHLAVPINDSSISLFSHSTHVLTADWSTATFVIRTPPKPSNNSSNWRS